MQPKFFHKLLSIVIAAFAVVAVAALFRSATRVASAQGKETSGSLLAVDSSGKPKGACPLKHTDVKAEISGFLSRVNVTQEFENNLHGARKDPAARRSSGSLRGRKN